MLQVTNFLRKIQHPTQFPHTEFIIFPHTDSTRFNKKRKFKAGKANTDSTNFTDKILKKT